MDRHRTTRDNLPQPLTSFVGREAELRTVARLLQHPGVPLLTVTGPGGVGKTRLALEVARQLDDAFPDDMFFVSLAPISNPRLVLPTIAQHVGIRETGQLPPSEQLQILFADQRSLIILDSFERVVDAAPQLTGLLAACPHLKMLVTSRIVLRVQGEQELPLTPLALVESTSVTSLHEIRANESVELFVQRAKAVRPAFDLSPENAPLVAEICTRLDGLPLAIELAAARIRLLQPQGLLARLTHRLPLLTGGPRDAPTRHQTLQKTIAWSYDLLAIEEQRCFRQLAVFVDGFTEDAAHSVCDPISIDLLASLIDSSLLVTTSQPDGTTRFLMLETIREFGSQALRETDDEQVVRQRHADWCLKIAGKMWDDHHDSFTERTVELVRREQDNIRAALVWLSENGDRNQALKLANRFSRFWFAEGHIREARSWFTLVLETTDDFSAYDAALGLLWQSIFEWLDGDYNRLEIVETQILPAALESGDSSTIAWTLVMSGVFAELCADDEHAATLVRQGIDQLRNKGPRWQLPYAMTVLGRFYYHRQDFDHAKQVLDEALTIMDEQGYRWGRADILTNLARIARQRGAFPEALDLYREALDVRVAYGDRINIASCLRGIGELLRLTGSFDLSARFYGAAEALREGIGVTIPTGGQQGYDHAVAALRAELGDEAFDAAWSDGRALSPSDAVASVQLLNSDTLSISADMAPARTHDPYYGLTPRERDVLGLLVQGLSSIEIANQLHISPRTERTHVNNIFAKLDVHSRAAAVAFAFQHGLKIER